METLELKHLKGYLGTGLIMELIDFPFSEKFGKHYRKLELDLGHDFHFYLSENKVRPVVRPLSDITKEIEFKYEDNNGMLITYPKKISVMQYLNIAKTNPHKYRPRLNRFEYSLGNGTVSYNFDVNGQLLMPYDIVNLLFINHFDVHNLLPNGLAIDKNTLP